MFIHKFCSNSFSYSRIGRCSGNRRKKSVTVEKFRQDVVRKDSVKISSFQPFQSLHKFIKRDKVSMIGRDSLQKRSVQHTIYI